ncbi:hypothetical protein Tco_0528793 [Tanacetum coccineum]
MSAMPNVTLIIATVKEKTLKEADAVPKACILDFCKKHYEDILPIIMDRARHDKRKEVQTRLDFRESSKKIRREKENSLNSRAGNWPIRFHHERSRTRGRERHDDRNVFNRPSHRKKSVLERISDTYSPSITKSWPSRASSRDPSHSRGRSLSRDRPRIRDRLRGVEESYDDTYSSHGTGTKYRDRSRDRDHSRSVKRCRESESPPSRGLKSSTSNRGHWKSKAKRCKPTDEEDLALPPESIDGYKGLKAAFLAYFMQQKKYVKYPVEIHNIKQRDGETIEEFMEHFKIESGRMKGAPKCM